MPKIPAKVQGMLVQTLQDRVKVDFSKYFKTEEPFYYRDPNGRKKRKKSKYRLPGVSEHDNKVLAKVRSRAWTLDMCLMHCCGFRFGWAAVFGVIPVVGDALGFLLACWVIHKAQEIEGGLPQGILAMMYWFAFVDLGVGFIPILGDMFDAWYKANTRNTWLLEDYLVKKANEGPAGVSQRDLEKGEGLTPQQPQRAHRNGG